MTDLIPFAMQITVANFSSDSETATLWESHQVTEHLEQRILPVGRWVSGGSLAGSTGVPNPSRGTTAREDLAAEEVLASHPSVARVVLQESVRVERRTLDFGLMEAPVDDPPLRRLDLTGLHVRCTTVEVRVGRDG